MSEQLMIEETTVYEIDLECVQRKQEKENFKEANASGKASSSSTLSKKEPAR